MSKLLTFFIATAILCGGVGLGHAQAPKHQSETIDQLPVGRYTAYLTHKLADGKYEGGLSDRWWEVISIEPGKDNLDEHFVLNMMMDVNAGEAERIPEQRTYKWFPDDIAFPITYYSSSYDGSPKLVERIGWIPNRPSKQNNRMVYLDGKIYFMEEFTDKDNYDLVAVLEPGNPPTGLKMMKAVMQSIKKTRTLDPDAKLQAYLDAAYAERDRYYAQWKQNPTNAAKERAFEAQYVAMKEGINQTNEEWFASEEYAAIALNNQRAEERKAASEITVKNTTSSTIYVYIDGTGAASSISGGSTGTFPCDEELYYSSRDFHFTDEGSLFHSGGGCGTEISVP